MTLVPTQAIDPKDLDPTASIYADWGLHVPQTDPKQPALKSVGLTINDYTTRFINAIRGAPNAQLRTQQGYYISYVILIGLGVVTYWYIKKRG